MLCPTQFNSLTLYRKTNSSSNASPVVVTFATSGRLDANATLPDAIVPIFSRQTKTDGSGRDLEQRSVQLRNAILATGVTQEDTVRPSPTTERLPKETTNHAYRSSTISTMTDSSGTTLPVTILSPSSARIPMNCWTLCDIAIPVSSCKQLSLVSHRNRWRIYIIYKW